VQITIVRLEHIILAQAQISTSLPIDECEEWIWEILDSAKNSSFDYITDEDKEFLILNTNDFHADTRSLYKIRRITGMKLAQMSTHNRYTQLWFCRSTYPTNRNKSIAT
jgi:hypothetical protein